jgi:hypothetical protein
MTSDGGRPEQCHIKDERRSCGLAVGTCVPGVQTCNGEFWGPCVGGIGPAPEECDGLDHDCDGIPNNRPGGCDCQNGEREPCYNGPPGTQGVGTCRAGTRECFDGRWGECLGAIEPEPGNCLRASCTGGPNPGCECVVGDTRSCYSGSPSQIGVGICHAGIETCVAAGPTSSTWGPCEGQQLPEAEQCDGQDHDCNGVPNDRPSGCVCSPGQTQSCYTGPAGTLGVGTCRAGTQPCILVSGTYTWGTCTNEVAPQPGNCDVPSCTGPDDPNPGCDCINGRTRSCYEGPPATLNVGACIGGTQTCLNGTWGACLGQRTPAPADSCVPPSAAYASYKSSDLNCNGTLDRHNPVAQPTATAPSGATISPVPSGYVYALLVQPLDTVTLRGGATDQDGTGSYSYRWRIVLAPQNNTAGISGAPGATPNDYSTQQNPTLFAQLAGDYQIGVRAIDSTGCQSDEVKVLIRVKPHSAIHLQMTWDQSVDVDLQLGQGESAPLFVENACYWGNFRPDWGAVDPSLDIDDLAGCNPENINYGSIGGTQPPLNSKYSVWVHYYCNRRGHRTSTSNPNLLCYEMTENTTPVNVTVKVFVDGVLAKIDGTTQDAVFTRALTKWQTWKPAILHYDSSGVWRIIRSAEAIGSSPTSCNGSSTCTCSQLSNPGDPYCGTSGAACRQRYP